MIHIPYRILALCAGLLCSPAAMGTELLGKMEITNYVWQNDVSGLPKSAAGSSMRSRDMLSYQWPRFVIGTVIRRQS